MPLKNPTVPPAILVNPHVNPASYVGAQELCTVGLCFKVAHALVRLLRQDNYPPADKINLRAFLPYAALGTVADLVALTGENRVYAYLGLRELARTTHPGLRALLKVTHLDRRVLNSRHIAFQLAPRINAAGRVADPTDALQLLLCQNPTAAVRLAEKLNAHNLVRQGPGKYPVSTS